MVLARLLACYYKDHKQIAKRTQSVPTRLRTSRRWVVEQLEDRTAPTTFNLAVEGDSLSTAYSGSRGSQGDMSWTQLLNTLRSGAVSIHNVAQDGATSTSLLASGQRNRVAAMVRAGTVHYVVLEIGGNDEQSFTSQIIAGDYSAFVNTVVSNIEQALSIVQSAGPVQQVLGLLPNIGFSPSVQNALHHDPILLGRFATAVNLANQQLEVYASAHGIVCVDLYALGQLTQRASITLAGTATNDYWSPDYVHPSSVMQGLFANSVMRAFQLGYGADTHGLVFTDQEILAAAHDGPPRIPTPTYFDVTPFVILPSDQPVGLAGVWTAPNVASDSEMFVRTTLGAALGNLGGRHSPSTSSLTVAPEDASNPVPFTTVPDLSGTAWTSDGSAVAKTTEGVSPYLPAGTDGAGWDYPVSVAHDSLAVDRPARFEDWFLAQAL